MTRAAPIMLVAGWAALACGPSAAPVQSPRPTETTGATTAVASGRSITAGVSFTCAVTPAKTLKCWGRNDHGQLGVASTQESWPKASAVADLAGVASVGAGRQHACALLATGSVKCWGVDETAPPEHMALRSAPTEVLAPDAGAVALAVGGRHDCALLRGGKVQCFGWGSDGQLGSGNASSSRAPVDVVGLSRPAVAIAAGDVHSCALLDDGSIDCWGSARFGRLGSGDTQQYAQSATPLAVAALGAKATSVAAGRDGTCAVTASGVACWGRVKPGRPLSDSDPTLVAATPIAIAGLGPDVRALTFGAAHGCAVTKAGAAMCWGYNERGQLGNGQTADSATPVQVAGLTSGVVAIAGGDLHTCALLDSGEARCWGDNGFGQLGDGTTKDSATPVKVVDFP